jgi:geranylgeranyl diphosphate synthase type I
MVKITDYLTEKKLVWVKVVEDYCQTNNVSEFLKRYLLTGGKWHRPTLAEIGYHLAGGKGATGGEKAFVALELIHRYLLVHDDIVDQDLVRHGSPTLEQFYKNSFQAHYPNRVDETYSKGMAMIAGDVIGAMAYDLLSQAPYQAKVLLRAVAAVSQLLVTTAEGWRIQTDQNFMPIRKVSEAEFIRGMDLVSAQYSFVWPLRIGQVLAGQDKFDQALDDYGYHVGIAFKIKDDYLGMFGDEKETGKPVGHDYREGKKTLLVLKSYGKLNKKEREFFDSTLGNHPTKADLEKAKNLMQQTGAVEWVMKLAHEHIVSAKAALKKVDTNNAEAMILLEQLADLMLYRAY